MSVDPLEVSHDVEKKLARFNILRPAGAPSEVFFGCAGFDLAEDFLFAEKLASHPRVFGHKHRCGPPRAAHQSVHHLADLMTAGFRKADAAFDALGGKRHQALLDDVAGMLDVGRE